MKDKLMMMTWAFPIWPGLDTSPRLRQRKNETVLSMEAMPTRKVVREMLLNRPETTAAKR